MARYPLLQKSRARKLRESQTNVENRLWARLRDRQIAGVKFRRQHPIGPFIADFCCVEAGVVVELDGGQHAEQFAADERRTKFIEQRGYKVLRFWDNEVIVNIEGVLQCINAALDHPHPSPLPLRGRGDRN
jgi:very-short-patch-repair endonuclease